MSETQATTKARPIIFSASEMRAILDGRKTQARYVVKPQPPRDELGNPWGGRIFGPEMYAPVVVDKHGEEDAGPEIYGIYDEDGEWGVKCPYGQPGDLLWVKEVLHVGEDGDATYAADGAVLDVAGIAARMQRSLRLRCGQVSPLFMPRWASRVTLRTTNIRAEWLQDISEADAIAEGCQSHYCSPEDTAECEPGTPERALAEILEGGFLTAKCDFIDRWDQRNGKKPGCAWADNPLVWVRSFEREVKP